MIDLIEMIEQHLAWYPLMELRDIYKLIYQGVLGSEHLVTSADEFTDYLIDEFKRLEADPTGRLAEPVRADGALLRINLRPYKSLRQDVDALAPLLLECAAEKWGELADFKAAWGSFVGDVMQGRFTQFTAQQVNDFTAWVEDNYYPALHHSNTYRQHYHPAYRLISSKLFHRLELDHAG